MIFSASSWVSNVMNPYLWKDGTFDHTDGNVFGDKMFRERETTVKWTNQCLAMRASFAFAIGCRSKFVKFSIRKPKRNQSKIAQDLMGEKLGQKLLWPKLAENKSIGQNISGFDQSASDLGSFEWSTSDAALARISGEKFTSNTCSYRRVRDSPNFHSSCALHKPPWKPNSLFERLFHWLE